ncbi:MAG: hypothetical protein KGL54_10695 [Sphingomonadales bacterium]|nr:hypothetical protein [Sphingomonadales bacterium]
MSPPATMPSAVNRTDLLTRAAEAEALGRNLLDMAARLRGDAADEESEETPDEPPDKALSAVPLHPDRTGEPTSLARTAALLLGLRQRRIHHLGQALTGELAWDILLTLFEARLGRRDLTFAQLCTIGEAYPATTRRWITALASLGLVELHSPPGRPAAERVRLTRKGERAMSNCLSGLIPAG